MNLYVRIINSHVWRTIWFAIKSSILVLPTWSQPASADTSSRKEIDTIIAPGTKAVVVGHGYGFTEGPAADADGNIYFSDGKNDSIYLYEVGRPVRLFVDDSLDANGMMFNEDGELLVCEGAAYRVVAFDVKTRKKRVLVGAGQRRFNEPNDLAIDRTGGFYFTDPNYKHRGQESIVKQDTYYRAADGKVDRVSTVCERPNGVLLTADGKTLYLADSKGQAIYRYRVQSPGVIDEETRWAELDGRPDGMTTDRSGNLYVACGAAGIKVLSPNGKLIGEIGRDYGVDYASNCCFGGPTFSTLFVTSRDKFISIETKVHGTEPLPRRKRMRNP